MILLDTNIVIDMINNQEDSPLGTFAARFSCSLRDSGLIVPVQDAIISYLALKFNCSICTKDKHFKLIKDVEEKLTLI